MTFTRNAVANLGKRFRHGNLRPGDLELLTSYCRQFDPVLGQLTFTTGEALASSNIKSIVVGRSKRVKSIVRKLRRDGRTASLDGMVDLIGARIIVDSRADQDNVLQCLTDVLQIERIRDYRGETAEYRCVHVYVTCAACVAEIQIRTLAEHLWADESESFGEQVKEGGGDQDVREYLALLSAIVNSEGAGTREIEDFERSNSIASSRCPISRKLPQIATLFGAVMEVAVDRREQNRFVVVYDAYVDRIISVERFSATDQQASHEYYSYQTALLDESRFDVVLLIARTKSAARVTHARLFPDNGLIVAELRKRQSS